MLNPMDWRRTLSGVALLGALAFSSTASAGFDWGSDCSSGNGSFLQNIPLRATTVVGEIPPNKRSVEIELTSNVDVDIQLIDKATGAEIIAWPNGMLNGPSENCTTYQGLRYCYSGYNGVGGNLGREWIRVEGDTNRTLIMKAYGYQAGSAPVEYRWSAVDTCNEVGNGAFAQQINQNSIITVGDIPAGKVNVAIELTARQGKDVDIQLYDGNTALVKWPDGSLNGPTSQSFTYQGMEIVYSGYNGIGGNWGREKIEIKGVLTRTLTMKAFGYQAGFADVTYQWGIGAGASCAPGCGPGLVCKSSTCHTASWCLDDASAASQCAALGSGPFSCSEFVCQAGGPAPACGDGTCSGGEDCGSCSADCGVCPGNPAEDEMLTLVNQLRASGAVCGSTSYPPVSPVTLDTRLRDAARAHALDMGQNGYFAHNSQDGRTPFQRMAAAGYTGAAVSENIAAGNAAASTTFNQWVTSPGHCANMMAANVNELGVGYANVPGSPYTHYWVQNFGRE